MHPLVPGRRAGPRPIPFTRALATLALAGCVGAAVAAPVSFAFEASVDTGPFAGEVGSGVIRFDDAFSGTLSPTVGGLEIDFTLLGRHFDETHDPGFPDFPEVTVFNGRPVAIDFILLHGSSGVDFGALPVGQVSLQGTLLPAADGAPLRTSAVIDGRDPGDPNAVPEPATVGLAALALLGLGRRRRVAAR